MFLNSFECEIAFFMNGFSKVRTVYKDLWCKGNGFVFLNFKRLKHTTVITGGVGPGAILGHKLSSWPEAHWNPIPYQNPTDHSGKKRI